MGKAIIAELLKDEQRFSITAVTRPASTYTPPPNSNITHRKVDYASSSSLLEAFRGQDAIVNCVTGGATQYDPSKLIIDAAVAAGVKFFFANEFVGYVTSERFKRLPESHVGAKVRIREYLQELGKEGKISWTSLNGGPFFDMCKWWIREVEIMLLQSSSRYFTLRCVTYRIVSYRMEETSTDLK